MPKTPCFRICYLLLAAVVKRVVENSVACGAPPNASRHNPEGVFDETRAGVATRKRSAPGRGCLFHAGEVP